MDSEIAEGRRESLMARAIDEASQGRGRTRPNPLVGAVLARDGHVVATGYHPEAGREHAEIQALQSVEGSAEGTTMYVNLEPCCHHGRTPPCTDAIIEAGVEQIFVAMEDPDPRVSGEGIRLLREAGIDVQVGLLESEARELNRAYLVSIEEGRPMVVLKYAMTADGKIATRTGASKWITGESARRRVHELRDTYDAVLVGAGTLRADDPRLTCRIEGGRDPIRAAIDTDLSAPMSARLFDSERSDAETVVYTGPKAPQERRNELRDRGIQVVEVGAQSDGQLLPSDILEDLKGRELLSVMVEGGGGLAASLFEANLVDRVHAFIAPKVAGGRSAITPVEGEGVEQMNEATDLQPVEVERFEGDFMITFDVVGE